MTDMPLLLCSFFRLDEYFYVSLLENKIASNMRKVILCEGNYNEASSDIKLLTKYYLSIETRMILELNCIKYPLECVWNLEVFT